MGITLEITTVSNSSEVQTAAEALIARGVELPQEMIDAAAQVFE